MTLESRRENKIDQNKEKLRVNEGEVQTAGDGMDRSLQAIERARLCSQRWAIAASTYTAVSRSECMLLTVSERAGHAPVHSQPSTHGSNSDARSEAWR